MSLHTHLRETTDVHHQALHVHPALAPLISKHVTFDQYLGALQVFEIFYLAMEPQLTQNSNYESAPVLHWLQADREQHGYTISTPSDSLAFPQLKDAHHQLAYLYVKQGSMLGGSVISKQLRKHLQLTPGINQHFFHGYGSETGNAWKTYLATLEIEGHKLTSEEWDDMANTANACFITLHQLCDMHMTNRLSHTPQAACS